MKWFIVGVVIVALFGAVALWAASPLAPNQNPMCKEGFVELGEDDNHVYFVAVYKCPKREV